MLPVLDSSEDGPENFSITVHCALCTEVLTRLLSRRQTNAALTL